MEERITVEDIGSSSRVVEMEELLGDFDPAVEMERRSKQYIYLVPKWIKDLSNSKGAYQPRLVSLGPFHHLDPELLPMNEHKWRAVFHLLERSGRPLQDFIAAVEDVAEELEAAYGQDLDLKWRGEKNREQFVQLMVTDGCFILEAVMTFLQGGRVEEYYKRNDPVFSKHGYLYLSIPVMSDMLVMENQLPLLLLQKLFRVAYHVPNQIHGNISVNKMMLLFLGQPPNRMAGIDRLRLHPLDVLHESISGARRERTGWKLNYHMPCAAEIHEAGIHFKVSNSQGFAGAVSFAGGVLSIPKISVMDSTECRFLNLMAFERLHPGAGNDVMAFVIFMDLLINTAKDVSLLKSKGIIKSALGSDEQVANLFNNILSKGAVMSDSSSLHDVRMEVSVHCKKTWNKWRASFIHTYLSNPWVFLSLVAAFILLVATLMQTVYTVVPFYSKS